MPVGKSPHGVAVDPGTHTVYITNYADGTVSVLDGSTRTVTATVPVGEKPCGVAPVDRVAHTIYVTNYSGHGVCDRTSVAFPSGLSALVVLRTPGHEDIVHLRDVLGEQTYESLAHKGEAMTTAAIVAYAYDQIDQARAELNAVSKQTTYEGLESSAQFCCRIESGPAPPLSPGIGDSRHESAGAERVWSPA